MRSQVVEIFFAFVFNLMQSLLRSRDFGAPRTLGSRVAKCGRDSGRAGRRLHHGSHRDLPAAVLVLVCDRQKGELVLIPPSQAVGIPCIMGPNWK
jgi:hypothetical protein